MYRNFYRAVRAKPVTEVFTEARRQALQAHIRENVTFSPPSHTPCVPCVGCGTPPANIVRLNLSLRAQFDRQKTIRRLDINLIELLIR